MPSSGVTPPVPRGPGAPGFRPPDEAARQAAVNPRRNIVLEASAGTGKTWVLVNRYVNLVRENVDPANILAITFTRAAAAEMRARIIAELRAAADRSPEDQARWAKLRDRLGEIAVCTIDAFCLLLLREFPLEANLDPAFEVADESAMATLVEESLDSAMRIARSRARTAPDLALLFAQLGEPRLRAGLASLVERRLVAVDVLRRVLSRGPRDLTIESASEAGRDRLIGAIGGGPGGVEAFLGGGPLGLPRFAMLAAAVRAGVAGAAADPAALRRLMDQLAGHLLTKKGEPRQRLSGDCRDDCFPGGARAKRDHQKAVAGIAAGVLDAIQAFRRDLNVILSRAVWQVFRIALECHLRTLDAHGVLDFGELLSRATQLLGQMDEFARSRYLLDARYHHVLVDEFQDTSRAQWGLVSQLVHTWGEGLGVTQDAPLQPSIFIVGDRKQSIYGFRDAEVRVINEAADAIASLKPADDPRYSISHSFRSRPALLAFANDVFDSVTKEPDRPDAFTYGGQDAFPIDDEPDGAADEPLLGVTAATESGTCAAAVAREIERLLAGTMVRDPQQKTLREARPGDIAILFRSRASHRDYERALDALGIPSYVYKGLGFFDAPEILDVVALIRYLADPASDLRTAALLRSRIVRLSDPGLQRLAQKPAPGLARALSDAGAPAAMAGLTAEDRSVFGLLRQHAQAWLALVDRVPPAELIDTILAETAYLFELRGPRHAQARENVKKIRSLVRRIQNRGYRTFGRLADELDQLRLTDESNATIDALDAVKLMTVHAAKGLEFPVVFIVNLARGTRGTGDAIRLAPDAPEDEEISIGDFRNESDADAGDRDKEETKRLLYVAVTRARDRLYLSSLVKDGKLVPGPRSLGSVMPESLKTMIAGAATGPGDVETLEWPGPSGRVHRFRRCQAVPASPAPAVVPGRPVIAGLPGAPDDFTRLADSGAPVRVSVTDVVKTPDAADWGPPTGGDRDALAAGSLVHRLFQFEVDPADRAAARLRASALLDDEERAGVRDAEAVIDRALAVYTQMRARPGVRAILDEALCFYEVPVSFGGDGEPNRIVRGVIDCVACRPGGEVVVVDFKTGAPRETDQRQLDLYVSAARHLYPGAPVRGAIVYPD